ncbi:sigma-54 dependent transcriptional regulator [Flavitalea sp. BT771]|uniref:sigma-54-dependent transcriptional regulator n=1 Tax=Flavitalea sp. BT771 TaxID=3063329 RepID=UPI0026E23DA7|nr:sigma-54 dependent transcriptional regulator [Flavitalea sp. BT771]MDO6431946.1 sigma-54 dependent transcriptional regulator [Flavitalea sp. BT771]MDV6220855.1 sigma-54 dependent transcriptional regulator [Flavitalea sp. BT771]
MILIIEDDKAVRISLLLLLQQEGHSTKDCGSPDEALAWLIHHTPSLIILDLNFSMATSGEEGMRLLKQIRKMYPVIPVILITGWATIELAVAGMKAGACDFVNKPWNNDYLLQSIHTILNLQEKKVERLSRSKLDDHFQFQHIIGEDPRMLDILATIGRIAATDASVLIMGESGTGKELIAEAIHQNSLRNNKPFVKVNLGGISSTLFESEMFGHVRGAFTDAKTDRVGRFEMANKGSIFLDEIGDLDHSSQVKLLRVLQDRSYEPLGSSRSKTVNIRVICATNRNLQEMIAGGSFREDLFYRINLITIRMPALRERPKDIPLLVNHFVNNLREIYDRPGLSVTPETMAWLQRLPLPGNIRQLKNLVERTILVTKKDLLEVNDFQEQVEMEFKREGPVRLPEVGTLTLEEMEIQMIHKAMDFHKHRITKVAKALGITRSALYRRLEKYNIPYDEASD